MTDIAPLAASLDEGASFRPLGLAEISAMSPRTRRAIAMDLAGKGELGQLSAMLPCIPLLHGDSEGVSGRLDLTMAARLASTLPPEKLPGLIAAAESMLARCAGQVHCDGPERDFGPLACFFSMKALAALAQGDSIAFAAAQARAAAILLSPKLPCDSPLAAPHANASPIYGFLAGAKELADATLELRQAIPCGLGSSGIPTLAPALALARLGEPLALDALLARPEVQERLFFCCSPSDRWIDSRAKEMSVLEAPSFWAKAPELAAKLLDAGVAKRLAEPPFALQWRVARAMAIASESNPSHPAFSKAVSLLGERALSPSLDGAAIHVEAMETAMRFCLADSSCLPIFKKSVESAFSPAKPHDRREIWKAARKLLFSPAPGLSGAFCEAYASAQPAGDPFADCLASANIEQHIEAICHCGDPAIATKALESIGIAKAQAFPGHRKGLDLSLAMWICKKAPLPIFEAALDWFESHGGLREQAEAKAWVHRGTDTIKKGDLLASCVAQGKTDFARALLRRLPDLDVKPAKEVAKALAAKAGGGAASAALSSWEDLLLSRTLEAKAAKEPPAPPRRSRSL